MPHVFIAHLLMRQTLLQHVCLYGRLPRMRPQAPPYRGEGPHALWHVSEEPGIASFAPRPFSGHGQVRRDDGSIVAAPKADGGDPLVWAVDTRHLPMYWFPRDCPRGTFWARPETTDADVERFLDGDRSRRVHAVESAWLERMRVARVFAYRVPEVTFRRHDTVGGYWISTAAVEPLERVELGDLVARHADARIELRIVPSIWPLWDRVVASTVEFSGMRLRNAGPRTEQPRAP
jgi:hypothetical protein